MPDWSPDGSKIAFAAGSDIFVMDPDGGNRTNLTNFDPFSASGYDPAWSPDGSKIAFTAAGVGIVVMDSNGANRTTLIQRSAGVPNSPAWSPDGKRIVFVRDGASIFDTNLWVMNADGSGPTRLTKHRELDLEPDWQTKPGT